MCATCDANTLTVPVGTQGAQGLYGGFSTKFKFGLSTVPTPSTSEIRLNNSTYSAATFLYVSSTNFDSIGVSNWLTSFNNSGSFGFVRLFKETDSTIFITGQITSVTNNGSDYTLGFTYISSSGTFLSGDGTVLTFSATGPVGPVNILNTDIETHALDSNFTLTAGTSKNIVLITSNSTTVTTASRTWTLLPVTGQQNNFRIIIPSGVIGATFNITIVQGINTLIVMQPGTINVRQLDFYWNGSSYTVVRSFPDYPGNTNSTNGNVYEGLIGTEWQFGVQGGSPGTISFNTVLPDGVLLKTKEAFIECIGALTSAGTSQVSWGYTDVVDAFDSARDSAKYPYNSINQVVKPSSYGTATGNSVSINKKSGVITTATLSAAAGVITSITLTNSIITADTKVNASLGTYSGTYNTNGLPNLLSVDVTNGQVIFKILNMHSANALNGTINIMFSIVEHGNDQEYLKIQTGTPVNLTMTITGSALTAGYIRILIPYIVRKV